MKTKDTTPLAIIKRITWIITSPVWIPAILIFFLILFIPSLISSVAVIIVYWLYSGIWDTQKQDNTMEFFMTPFMKLIDYLL